MSSILSDSVILAAVNDGRISITPFRREHVNPTSYDLTLGDMFAVYEDVTGFLGESRSVGGSEEEPTLTSDPSGILDARSRLAVRKFRIDPNDGVVIRPGIGYLMHTVERISTSHFVPVLDGKSTIGRLFVSIHETAGFGDVGFDGQFTLEVTCTHPVRLYSGMRIGQVRFHTIYGEVVKPYNKTGTYKGSLADGPVPSQSYRMFEKRSSEE